MFKLLQTMKGQRRGQSTLEYAVLIVIIIGALLTIQVYIKRGVQGRLHQAADDIGDQFSVGNTNVLKTTLKHSVTKESFANGVSSSNLVGDESTNTQEHTQIINVDQEFWGQSK